MIGDDREPSAWPKDLDRGVQSGFEGAQLIVDRNPKRLKDQGGRIVSSTPAHPCRLNQLQEVGGRSERFLAASLRDGTSESMGPRQLAVLSQPALDGFGTGSGEEIRCRFPLARIHAHVQRGLARIDIRGESEASMGGIQLMRGDPEIEQHTVDAFESGLAHRFVEVCEGGSDRPKAGSEFGQAHFRSLEGFGVAIDSQKNSVRSGSLEDQSSMAAASQRAIHNHGARTQSELRGCLLQENGQVMEVGTHELTALRGATPRARASAAGPEVVGAPQGT